MRDLRLPVLFIFLFSSVPIKASTGGMEESLFGDIPVVIAASLRRQDVSQAPASVDVVSGKEIRERGYRTLKEVMKDLPGFNDVADSNENIMAVRGVMTSTFNKVLIMVNGHRLNDLLLGRADVDAVVGMDAVERIEFIRGPVSTLYGSGALVGAINIITREGGAVEGEYFKARGGGGNKEFSVTMGSVQGARNTMAHFTSLDLKAGRIHQPAELDDVPSGGTRRAGFVYWNRMPNNWTGTFTMNSTLSALTVRGERIERTTARGAHGSFFDPEQEPALPNWQDDRFFVDYSREFVLPGSVPQKIILRPSYHSYSIYDQSFPRFFSDERPPYGDRLGLRSQSHQAQLKLTYEVQPVDTVRLMAGLDDIWANFTVGDRVDVTTTTLYTIGPKQFTPAGTWRVDGYFAQGEWSPFPALNLLAGARYDVFSDVSDRSQPGRRRDFRKLTKRASAVYKPVPSVTLKTLYGESFLAPMWMQIYSGNPAFFGNPDLEPESSNTLNFIAGYDRPQSFSATVDLFSTQVENLINSASASYLGSTVTRYFNTQEQRVRGYEVSLRQFLGRRVRLQGSYSYLMSDNQHTAASLLSEGSLRSIPKHTLRAGVRLEPLDDLVFHLWGRAYGRAAYVSSVGGVARAETISSSTVLDLSANYKVGRVDFQVTAMNALDKKYHVGGTIRRQMPQPGSIVEGKVGWQF